MSLDTRRVPIEGSRTPMERVRRRIGRLIGREKAVEVFGERRCLWMRLKS